MNKLAWTDIALGVWLIVSPLMLSFAAPRPFVVFEDFVPGAFLVATSCWILAKKVPLLRVNWLQWIDGLWLILGSFGLMFSHRADAALNVLVVGILVLTVYLVEMWELNQQQGVTV